MPRRPSEPDWRHWLDRWDEQQESFNPDREARFEAMFDILQAALPARFTALDLGCGPGSLTARLLRRFPRARSVAVDYDPVALRVGQGALRSLGNRITWVDANLGSPGWTRALPARRFDAAVSTTALHWLDAATLGRLYADLAQLLPRGGVLLNGDILPWGPKRRELRKIVEGVRRIKFRGKSLQSEWAGWTRWWRDIERVPTLRAEFAERKRRFPTPHGDSEPPPIDVHERAMRLAGFREIAVTWQRFENRILLGIR